MLNTAQLALIRESFEALKPQAEIVGLVFYQRLFKLDPSLRPMFRGNIQVQAEKLMAMLSTIVDWIDDPQRLRPVLEESGRRHVLYGVKDEHYAVVGEALLCALERSLGLAWNAATRDAWAAAYDAISSVMRAGAATEAVVAM